MSAKVLFLALKLGLFYPGDSINNDVIFINSDPVILGP
jgi:hypothetical protein